MVAPNAAVPPYALRPKERAFFTVDELGAHVAQTKEGATRMVAPTTSLRLVPDAEGLLLEVPTEGRALRISYRVALQLCHRVGLNRRFLEQVRPETAALVLNECLTRRTNPEEAVLLRADRTERALSVVSPRYAEAWDADVLDAIAEPLVRAGWIVPPYWSEPSRKDARPAKAHEVLPCFPGHSFTVREGDLIRPKGARSSDQDLHLFLVHPERVVDTADIMGRKVFRGLVLRHSETGDGPLKVEGFVFDYVCGNYMMYGSRQVFHLRLDHRSKGTADFITEAQARMKAANRKLELHGQRLPELARATAGIFLSEDPERRAREVEMMLLEAKVGRIFSRRFIAESIRRTQWGKYGAENTVWAVASGLTEQAQRVTSYAGRRAIYDHGAAALLDWAAANA